MNFPTVGTEKGNEFMIPVVPLTQILNSSIKHFAARGVFAEPSTTSTESFSFLQHKHTGQDSGVCFVSE